MRDAILLALIAALWVLAMTMDYDAALTTEQIIAEHHARIARVAEGAQ